MSHEKNNDNSILKDTLSSKKTIDSLQPKKINSIDEIKKEYNLVNSKLIAKKLDSVSFDYECEERSGNVVYYSENGILKVVKHFTADSHFSSTENYFVNENKPYFIFKDETVWSFDGGTPEKPETKDDIKENRYYYVNNKLTECREKTYTIRSKNNSKPENLSDGESKNCSDIELQKTFKLLLENKDKKEKINCL